MTLTQKQRLNICKFLAEKLGYDVTVSMASGNPLIAEYDGLEVFDPFTNPAQRWEVLDAAAAFEIGIEVCQTTASAWDIDELNAASIDHDNTPDSRATAVLVAIAKAWGWTAEVSA